MPSVSGSSPLARGLPRSTTRCLVRWGIIPARAGFTIRCPPATQHCYGSSPLARGLRTLPWVFPICRRIIPARAGFTPGPPAGSGGAADHPRSRGVYARTRSARVRRAGSSPLARGLLPAVKRRGASRRIIPARAGFTRAPRRPCGPQKDHPRSRGVYHFPSPFCVGPVGSSPLARGLRLFEEVDVGWDRIIPARAGFTFTRPYASSYIRDHPRSRGVYARPTRARTSRLGSSPLARGLPPAKPAEIMPGRIIPARAGFTSPHHHHPTSNEDHPRSRGVYAMCRGTWATAMGSSPLARGLLGRLVKGGDLIRIIPARAGFTAGGADGEERQRDHPRSRGVYAPVRSRRMSRLGSSPLARGLPCPGGRG